MSVFDQNTTTKTEIAAFQQGETAKADYGLQNLGSLDFSHINTTKPFTIKSGLSYLEGRDVKFVHGDIWVRTYYGDVYERIEGKRTTTVFHDDARTVMGNESLNVSQDSTWTFSGVHNVTNIGTKISQWTDAYDESVSHTFQLEPYWAEAVGVEFFVAGLDVSLYGVDVTFALAAAEIVPLIYLNVFGSELNFGYFEGSVIASVAEADNEKFEMGAWATALHCLEMRINTMVLT